MMSDTQYISLIEILQTDQWKEHEAVLPIALGKDSEGKIIVTDLIKMTHVLLGGTINSGKTNCIHNIINSLLYKCKPEDLRFIIYDPKGALSIYDKLPHMLTPVITDVSKVSSVLNWLLNEMIRRYQTFQKENVKNIRDFNRKFLKIKMPYIVCIVDEIADLMSHSKTGIETYIARLVQLGRAAGIHVIISTNRPNKNVIKSIIANNIPTRIAFKVTSQTESKNILESKGAEKLINIGEMLFRNNGSLGLVGIQSAHISKSEIDVVIDTLNAKETPIYCKELLDIIKLE